MRLNEFVATSNVLRLDNSLDRIHRLLPGINVMALIFGNPGLGKTKAILRRVANTDAIYVRMIAAMNIPWVLSTIVSELGLVPERRTQDLWQQCVEAQMYKRRTIYIDEADHMCADSRILELLRDFNDMTGVPVIFVGMELADKKLRRFSHLWDRFVEVLRFQPLTRADVSMIAARLCEVPLTDDAIDIIYNNAAGFRRIIEWLTKAEVLARVNNLKEVTSAHLTKGNGNRHA